MKAFLLFLFGSAAIAVSPASFLDEPRLQTIDGHLYIFGAENKNVSLMVSPKGYLNVNGENLHKVVQEAKQASASILSMKYNSLVKLEDDIEHIGRSLDQMAQRLNVCESLINNMPTVSGSSVVPLQFQMKVNKIERRVKTILRNLAKQECQKDPCMNGGTCVDKYLDYECRCPKGWEGKTCQKDVNECAEFAGTDLGCQNGATCINKQGFYECVCLDGWYGLHCTRRTNDCSSGSPTELCAHGTCVTQTVGSKGFNCICDQGWKTDGISAACNVDVDECVTSPCSRNPVVSCHNTPGSFFCGPCPPGYTGNGFICEDINECLVQNGGCSVQPLVQCTNVVGSSTCGPCPPGYVGDGKTCSFVGKCNVDNGGCASNARCQEVGSSVQCQCLPGYTGSGVGVFGCEKLSGPSGGNPCLPNPCRHEGRCYIISDNNFTCTCRPGYSGEICNVTRNFCTSNPCQNGGTCVSRKDYFFCRCTSFYTGKYCQKEKQNCGGYLNSDEGELQFPPANSSSTRYSHNLNCAWIIIVNRTLVINVTFEYFDLELAPECEFDWVQIHDGKSPGDHIIGKFCGNQLPNNGTIISTTNYIYMWFKTDGSKSRIGFKLKWTAVSPVCGGSINASIHGTIKSPGSPGKYPPNRDCLWLVTAPLGKRITFTFFEIFIETHENCSYDFLEFHEGLTLESPLLARYCNTTIPQPLTTPGNTALVYFHSDRYQSDRGFQIAFNPIPGYPGCGGIFTSRKGEISPPTEEGRYMRNMDCAWLIRMPDNLRIKIEFSSFRLEDGHNCNSDFVEVRDGSDVTSPLIGKYCGFVLPPVIVSGTNSLFVRFFSDNTIQSTGFRITYISVCKETFTGDSGYIKSPGYPNKYRSQEECVFLIEQPPGKIIQLEFQDFEFEDISLCFYDYVEIRDGNDERSPLIKRYCGNDRPPRIVSTHNYLWIKMVTDKDKELRGFYANYSTTDVSCGGIFTTPTGVINSPTEDGYYPPNHLCQWVIVGKPGEIIQLTFTTFKLEYHSSCAFDYVAVYDNNTLPQGGGLMGKFCGETVPPLLTTTDNVMTISFRSDTSLSMEGFTANYVTVNASTICGGSYFTKTGVIKSPNYPQHYPNSRTCVWVIRVPYGNKITLNVTNFLLEGKDLEPNQCTFDYLEIRDGGYESSPLIGRYCGVKIPKRIVSQSNVVYLKFKSDYTFSSLGFRIFWDGTLTGCGGVLSSVSGSIISPNYPEAYGANSLCIYKISVALGNRILLNIMDLDLENSGVCLQDYIEIFDGFDRSAKSLGKFCSSTNHPAILTSASNYMTIKFESDVSASGKGFYLKYRTECNTDVTGHRGVIESPNFPENFQAATTCVWIIKAPMGNKVNISFSDFNLLSSCDNDYLEIQEGNPTPTNTIGKFCRDKPPLLISSSLEWVHVRFTSSPTSLQGNFRMEWVVNGCGGTFIKPQGSFSSPNYPNVYPPNTVCEYYITVDPSYSIQLFIQDINFESLNDCYGDFLEVYGGPDGRAPLLTKICQKVSSGLQIQTSGNEMYLKFTSDHVTGGTGFLANYTTAPAKCGGLLISNQGWITSRNYPKNYNSMDNCHWVIQVEKNHRISFNFEDFDVTFEANCSKNFVEIFDGQSEDFPLLLKHCGNTLPTLNPVQSTSNFLTVRMTTDEGFPAKGFKAGYKMVCGATIIANEPGVINPSSYLQTQASPLNCSWTIVSPYPDGHITLMVSYLESGHQDVACQFSSLNVYEGSDRNGTLLASYCGRRTHLPIVSVGNVLYLELYRTLSSDVFFWATYSSASSACGGTLYGETGSFASPSYPGSYPTNSECVWTLQAAPGNKMQINFKEFDIGLTDHCNEEYLEIRERDAAGKLVGVYCGETSPANLTSFNALWLKFRSSKLGAAKKGFLADYNLVYSNEIKGKAGEIANPFYPKPFFQYMENINWRVVVDFGSVIRVTFKKVYMDDFYNVMCLSSVTIYDGYDETAPEMLKVCGLVKPEPVTSSSNIVYIVFTHSPVHHGSLFFLEWKQVSKAISLTLPSTTASSVCGGKIDLTSAQNRSITITNPGWPDPYISMLKCEWEIECPDYQHLGLTINVLEISQYPNCAYSHLAVSTKSHNEDWRELSKYCLSNETDRHVSATNFMKISILTGYEERSTFSVTVEKECGNSINKGRGVIRFHYSNYTAKGWSSHLHLPQYFFCQWDITVTPGKKIRVVFTEFDLPSSGDTCTDNYVLLKNGGSDDSPVLGKGTYCSFPGPVPLTTSNRLFVKAKTTFRGLSFSMAFSEVSPACGQRIKLDENFNVTIISSPNYPNIPPSKIECVWTFSTSGTHRLQIDFLERFDLTGSQNCDEEYVEVRDGGTLLSEELGRFCTDKPSTQKSSGNMLLVKYYTNATNPKNGFKAQISLARCGGVVRSFTGILTSPNYPDNYVYDTSCNWEIETDARYKLQVTFEDLDLPEDSRRLPRFLDQYGGRDAPMSSRVESVDFRNQSNCSSSAYISIEEPVPEEADAPFKIFEKSGMLRFLNKILKKTRYTTLRNICSNGAVVPVRSSANKMVIVFESGPNQRNVLDPSPRGFKLNFTSVGKGCVYRLDTPSGVISSPGYPNQAPNYYYCTWKITVPKGRRITLKVEDFDLPNSPKEQRVLLYNEHRYRSRIAILLGSSQIEQIYKSSSNLMLVTFWSSSLSGSGHRGFKFSYNSDEPQVCGGVLTEKEGVISSPKNISSFYCKWEFQGRQSENQTIAFKVEDSVVGNRTGTCSIKYGSVLAVTAKGGSNPFQIELCGNVSSQIIRSPLPYTFVTAIRSAWHGSVNFTVKYKINSCGGTVLGPEASITTPSYPNNYPPDVDCAWLISFPPGQSIKLTFQEFRLQPSCSDYLLVKNGFSLKSPLIGQYCGTSASNLGPITSEGSSLLIEFHSDSVNEGNGFKIFLEPANYVCGGVVHSSGYELMSPNFPSRYDNNQECEWEIISAAGTHIGLVFEGRFHIESSENCQNDFVKVYDYIKGDWKLLKTLCGRELPSPINSTSSKMKVLFRSNNAVVSDGFKAKWYQNCGETFWNVQSGVIVSPGYPAPYPGNLNCTYVIDHDEENTFLNFTFFQIERPFRGRCQYDSLSLYEARWDSNFELVGKFCGSKKPTPKLLRGKIKIVFSTDAHNNEKGFLINFRTTKCGGYVNESTDISYFAEFYGMYSSILSGKCVWEIVAPPDKIVSLRFHIVNLTFSDQCSYPRIDVTEGNGSVSLGRICGHLRPGQVVIKSSGNNMSVTLHKSSEDGEGFSASVILTYGMSSGCGGTVMLDANPETVQSPDVNGDGLYEDFLDCTWVVRAKPFHHVVATFRSLDVHACHDFRFSNRTNNCSCDYVELKDGADYHSDMILRTCGNILPPSVTSSGSVMSLKFSTDGAFNARGFNIKFSSKLSPCGVELLTPQETLQTLVSPNYPQNYPEGLRCKWTIFDPSTTRKRKIHVHILEWDIAPSDSCSTDFLFLEDTGFLKPLYQNSDFEVSRNKTTNSKEIIRGNPNALYFYEQSRPIGKTKFCGKGTGVDYYSGSDEVTVGFTTSSGNPGKGFKLEYSIAGCTRNYTGEQGQIKNLNFKNNSHCYITISAPTPNHTISLYFTSFTFGSSGTECSSSYMEVRDGLEVKSPLIGKFCGYSIPSPIFSNGQYLWIHFFTQFTSGYDYKKVDLTYTTTDQGKGCGGRFIGTYGTISSPGYPSNTRVNSVCRWDVSVPPGLEMVLQFTVLDIGPSNTCNSDFIEFYDVISKTDTEILRSRICGGDYPAEVRSSADFIAIKYTTSVHNGGTGWQLQYKAVTPGLKII